MKVLTIMIPCYNSQDYMEHCLQAILDAGEEERIQVLIIDDGSKDDTGKIADRWALEHPSCIEAVHQENGGHGEAINTGLKHAEGMYFKVVDSDDWLDSEKLREVLDILEGIIEKGERDGAPLADMFISNYVYDKVGQPHKKVMHYEKYLPVDRLFGWQEAKPMPTGTYILMHSVIYRTQVLRDCGLKLPAHTFYVDNLYVYQPLPYVKNLYYHSAVLYHYFIGRDDQSVNEKVMMGRIDQQLRVNRLMVDVLVAENPKDQHVYRYMRNYLDIITAISSLLCTLIDTEDALRKKEELWEYIRKSDEKLYDSLRKGLLGQVMHLPGKAGKDLIKAGYSLVQKFYGFN